MSPTPTAVKPLATSTSVTTTTVASAAPASVSFSTRGRTPTTRESYNPIFFAMVTGKSRMDNCHDVETMYHECSATNSDASICRTAAQYFQNCITQQQNHHRQHYTE